MSVQVTGMAEQHPLLRSIVLTVCLFLGSWSGLADAASVRQFGISEMLDTAGLVFQGRVVSRETRRTANGAVVTLVHFQVLDTIKGQVPGSGETLTLRFMGGERDGVRMRIPGMFVPEAGEEGIYIVETLNRHQINPLLGWDQGHFLIKRLGAGGRQEVHSRRRDKPIVDVEPAPKPTGPRLSNGLAKGMVSRQMAPLRRPLTPDEFKQRLRALLNAR